MQHYTENDLKQIGQQCRNKLPPTSAVQAMFLYEMQRESELEALFHGQLFRLSQTEHQTNSNELRLEQLEGQVKVLEKKVTAKDIEDRLSTPKVRTDILQVQLKGHTERLNGQEARLSSVESNITALEVNNSTAAIESVNMQDLEAQRKSLAVELTSLSAKLASLDQTFATQHDVANQLESLETKLTSLDDEVGVLFEERDALVARNEQAVERITKLEDLVRALARQMSSNCSCPSSATGSPHPPQLLPVKTNNSDSFQLAVPKGASLVAHKRDGIKPFTPGKQWMT